MDLAPDSVSGPCFSLANSRWSWSFAPPTPQLLALPCSPASPLLCPCLSASRASGTREGQAKRRQRCVLPSAAAGRREGRRCRRSRVVQHLWLWSVPAPSTAASGSGRERQWAPPPQCREPLPAPVIPRTTEQPVIGRCRPSPLPPPLDRVGCSARSGLPIETPAAVLR